MLVNFAPGLRRCSQTRFCTRLKSGGNLTEISRNGQNNHYRKLRTTRDKPATTATSQNTPMNKPSMVKTRKTKPIIMDTDKLFTQVTSGALDLKNLSNRSGGAHVLEKYRETRQTLGYFVDELYEQGRHEDIAVVVKVLRDADYNVKGGISTTQVKSYLDCGMWREAVALVQEMQWDHVKGEWCGLANLRLYNHLVTQAADDDHVKLACFYFREARKSELAKIAQFHRKAIRPLDETSLVSLLDCLIRSGKDRISTMSCDVDYTALELPLIDTKAVFHEVLVYLQNWRFPISQILLERIVMLAKAIGCHDATLTVEQGNTCAHCEKILLETSDFNSLCKEIVCNMERYMADQGLYKLTEFFDSLLDEHGYFDLLIDGGNVMAFLHNKPKAVTRFLSTVTEYPAKKPVFVASTDLIKFLPNMASVLNEHNIPLAEVPVYKNFNDDLSLLYLATKSECESQKNVTIVTHDRFGEHRFIAPDNHREYTHWLAERQFHYDAKTDSFIAANDRHSIGKNRIPPTQSVFCNGNGHFHLRAEDGRVCCLSPRMENGAF